MRLSIASNTTNTRPNAREHTVTRGGSYASRTTDLARAATSSLADAGLPYATREGQSALLAGGHQSSPPASALLTSTRETQHGNQCGSGVPDVPPLSGSLAPSGERRQVPPLLDSRGQPDIAMRVGASRSPSHCLSQRNGLTHDA